MTTDATARKEQIDRLMVGAYRVRRENMRRIIAERDLKSVAQAVNRSPSYVSQMTGKNPTRGITEKTARDFERALLLKPGTLDIQCDEYGKAHTDGENTRPPIDITPHEVHIESANTPVTKTPAKREISFVDAHRFAQASAVVAKMQANYSLKLDLAKFTEFVTLIYRSDKSSQRDMEEFADSLARIIR